MIDPKDIWSSKQLPTLPTAAVRLLELSKSVMIEIDDVVDVIKTDPALTARILKATNSSFYALRSEVSSIDRAVPLLGISSVTSLALGFSLIDDSMTKGPLGEQYQVYWMQCVVQATAAEVLAGQVCELDKNEAFQTGLLLDIGKLAMFKTLREDYLPVFESALDWQREFIEVEQEVLGFDHAEIGSKLAKNWQLPEMLCVAIGKHHAPVSELFVDAVGYQLELLKVSAMVSAIGDYFCGPHKGLALRKMRELCENGFDLSEEGLEKVLEQVRERFDASAEMFQLQGDNVPASSDLMAEANEQLGELAMRAQVESAMALQRQLAVEEEKKELKKQNQDLQQEAFRDALTGVYNRKYFDEALVREINRSSRDCLPVGLVFVDLDHFKNLNDTYGHRCGDLALQRVGKLMDSMLRNSDLVARYGGEEFVVVVHNPTEDGILNLAERIRGGIGAERIAFGGQTITLTASIGAAMAVPELNESDFGDKLTETADQAMYQSKRSGRNQVSILDMRQSKLEMAEAMPVGV